MGKFRTNWHFYLADLKWFIPIKGLNFSVPFTLSKNPFATQGDR